MGGWRRLGLALSVSSSPPLSPVAASPLSLLLLLSSFLRSFVPWRPLLRHPLHPPSSSHHRQSRWKGKTSGGGLERGGGEAAERGCVHGLKRGPTEHVQYSSTSLALTALHSEEWLLFIFCLCPFPLPQKRRKIEFSRTNLKVYELPQPKLRPSQYCPVSPLVFTVGDSPTQRKLHSLPLPGTVSAAACTMDPLGQTSFLPPSHATAATNSPTFPSLPPTQVSSHHYS